MHFSRGRPTYQEETHNMPVAACKSRILVSAHAVKYWMILFRTKERNGVNMNKSIKQHWDQMVICQPG